jgi:hypothetical protein
MSSSFSSGPAAAALADATGAADAPLEAAADGAAALGAALVVPPPEQAASAAAAPVRPAARGSCVD